MGRRPNAVIAQYFDRGPKLVDSSNRYQHTCKLCGEKFPKGRKEALENHLLKKCPAITSEQRRQVALRFVNLETDPSMPDVARNALQQQIGNNPAALDMHGNQTQNNGWAALETLAEASRQIEIKEKQGHRSGPQYNQSDGPARGGDAFDLKDQFELQEQWTPDNPPLSYEERVHRDKKSLSQKFGAHQSDANYNAQDMTTSPSGSPPLSMANAASIAAAASNRFVASMVDPQLLGEGLSADSSSHPMPVEPELNNNLNDKYFGQRNAQDASTPAWPMLDGSSTTMYPESEAFEGHIEQAPQANSFPRPMVLNSPMTTEFSAEFGNGTKTSKPKVRGRFTASRRKQVQEVRKKGACIRCRMLKKPCSEGTPCHTCAAVENARLWKCPCVRTRTADTLEMYSAGLHAVIAYGDIAILKNSLKFLPSIERIEVSLYPETGIFVSFAAVDGQNIQQSVVDKSIDPTLGGINMDFQNTVPAIRILDNENDDIPDKLEGYIKSMSAIFFEKEPSHFMNVTLNTALAVTTQKKFPLLSNSLDLWATVHILCDHELKWHMFQNAPLESGENAKVPIDEQGQSYSMVRNQLNAAAEKRASILCKLVLSELERWLLQSASSKSFETFLASLVLLNSIEKATWLFKSWEETPIKSSWPLDKAPSEFSNQGEVVTDLLQMLLRIRAIPPKTYHRVSDGTIATDQEGPAKEFYEKIHVNYAEVLNANQNPVFDPTDSRCYEMRFCSRLLLPALPATDATSPAS